MKHSLFSDDLHVVIMRRDLLDRLTLAHADAQLLGRLHQPVVELVAADDAKEGVAEERVALVVIEQAGLFHLEVTRLQRQPQVGQHVLAQMGDAAAAQLFARVGGLVDDDDAPGPSRIALDEVQRGGRSGRAGADDQYIYGFNFRHNRDT